MFKKTMVLSGVLLSLGLLGACGTGNSSNSSSDDTGKEVVTYAIWDKEQAPVLEELAADFQAENENIEIKFEITPWDQYWTKLETAATGKNAPDVFWMNIPNIADYIESGILEPLSEIVYDEDHIPEQYLEAYSSDGQLYGMPKDFDTQGLWYNKEMFDKAGVSYPDDSWTWETWQDAALKLTDAENGIYGMAIGSSYQGGYYETIYQNGGMPFSEDGKTSGFDLPETVEGLSFYDEFIKNGSGTPIETSTITPTYELLINKKVAMTMGGSYQTTLFFADEYGQEIFDVAPLPKGKVRATTSNSLANVVYSGSEHKESAQKWISFLATKEANEKVAEAGTVMPIYKDSQAGWVNQYPEKNLQVFVDAIEYAIPLPNYKNAMSAIALEQDPINQALTGEISVEDACQEITEKANSALAK